jgi:hypothetical protein
MAAPSLDHEFMQYWSKLSVVEKQSLMNVAKNYVELKERDGVEDVRRQLIQEERAAYLRGEGKSYSWQQIKEMAINKDQRHAL